MSTPDSTSLLMLIRLVHNDVPQDEGVRLREEMATNRSLADRVQRVLAARNQEIDSATFRPVEDVSPEEIASLVDGTMPMDQAGVFEEACYGNPQLLREVIECWRDTRIESHDPIPDAPDLLAIAVRQIDVRGGESASTDQQSPSSTERSWDDIFTSPPIAEQESNTANEVNGRKQPAGATLRQLKESNAASIGSTGSPNGDRRFVWAALAALTILLIAGSLLWPGDADRNAIAGSTNDQNSNTVESDNNRNPAPAPDDHISPSNTAVVQQAPDGTGPEERDDPDATAIANDVDVVRPQQVPDTLPPTAVMEPANGIPNNAENDVAAIAAISHTEGVVGVHDFESGNWMGWESRSGRGAWSEASQVRLVSILDSRALVESPLVGDIVLDAASDIEILAPGHPTSDSDIELNLRQGRIGLSLIDADRGIKFHLNGQDLVARTKQTSGLSIQREGSRLRLTVILGSIDINGETLMRRQVAVLSSGGQLTVESLRNDPDPWYRDRGFRSGLPPEACRALNSSSGLLADAARMTQSGEPQTAFLATQVLLQCSSRDTGTFPTDTIVRLASSQQEPQRHSVIHWLISRIGQQPSSADRMIQSVCDRLQIPSGQSQLMRQWFRSAVAGARPTLIELRTLTSGLQNRDHIFVRQCAKYFLQSILGDPLNEFDPARPNDQAAFQSVTRKLRAWQRANLQ